MPLPIFTSRFVASRVEASQAGGLVGLLKKQGEASQEERQER